MPAPAESKSMEEPPATLVIPSGVDPVLAAVSLDDGRGPGVSVLVSDGLSVLMICRELLLPVRSQWAVPAGNRNQAESPEGCAVRRVRETTGIRTDRGELLPLGSVRTAAGVEVNLFFTLVLEPAPPRPGDSVAAAEWFPAVMAVESAADGDITDALTCLTLFRASAKGLI
jgi:ADP-ribose pyrophosphatase YjhB (NUDIX family)